MKLERITDRTVTPSIGAMLVMLAGGVAFVAFIGSFAMALWTVR